LIRRQREIHAETGRKPFLAALRYETTAQTTWGSHEKIYMLNSTMSNYTVMQPVEEMKNLEGQDVLVVTTEKYDHDPLKYAKFDSCTRDKLMTFRHGVHARTFYVNLCKNFQGIIYSPGEIPPSAKR
jgi:dolichol-phosphate mannosyltransferase